MNNYEARIRQLEQDLAFQEALIEKQNVDLANRDREIERVKGHRTLAINFFWELRKVLFQNSPTKSAIRNASALQRQFDAVKDSIK